MEKITIYQINKKPEEVDLLNAFKIIKSQRGFVILSKGEDAGNNLSKIYVSEIIEEDPTSYKLIGITDKNIWNEVKAAMKEIVDQKLSTIEYLDLSGKKLNGDFPGNTKAAALASSTVSSLGNYSFKKEENNTILSQPQSVTAGPAQAPKTPNPAVNNVVNPQPNSFNAFNAEVTAVPETPQPQSNFNPNGFNDAVKISLEENNSFGNPASQYKQTSNGFGAFGFETPEVPDNPISQKTEENDTTKDFAAAFNGGSEEIEAVPTNNDVSQSNEPTEIEKNTVDSIDSSLEDNNKVNDEAEAEAEADLDIGVVNLNLPAQEEKKETLNPTNELNVEEKKETLNLNDSNLTSEPLLGEKINELSNDEIKPNNVVDINDYRTEKIENEEKMTEETNIGYKEFEKSQQNILSYVDGLKELHEKTTKDLYLTRKELSEFQEKCYTLEGINDGLEKSNKLLTEETNLREKRIRTYEKQIEELEEKIRNYESKLNDLERQISVYEEKDVFQNEEKGNLVRENEEQKDIIASLTVEKNRLEEEISKKDEAISAKNVEIEDLKKEKEELQKKAEAAEIRTQIAEQSREDIIKNNFGENPERTEDKTIEPVSEVKEPELKIVGGDISDINIENKTPEEPTIEIVPTIENKEDTVVEPKFTTVNETPEVKVETEAKTDNVTPIDNYKVDEKQVPEVSKNSDKSMLGEINLEDLQALANKYMSSDTTTDITGGTENESGFSRVHAA